MEAENQNTPGTEETTDSAAGTESSTSETSRKAGDELIDELTRLGKKFAEVLDVAWNSEQRRKIEEDLRTGLNSVATSLETGVKRAAGSKEAQDFRDAAEDVADRVRTHKVSVELADALSKALRTVSDKLDELAHEMQERRQAEQPKGDDGDDSQDIPITKV